MNPETQQEPSKTKEKMPLVYRLYGLFSIILGVYTLFAVVMFAALMTWALQTDPSMIIVGTDFTLPVVLLVISYVITFANGIALIAFGRMLRKGSRRNAARISHALIAASVVQILFKLMLQGVDLTLIPDAIQLFLLIAVSVTVDPSLKQERALERHVRDMVDREAAEEGMLGRDLEGKGFIELNFFNLFWVFVICCFLGLIIETVYHFAVVVPGEIQDRAGLLYGPFSPIYGFGAVLMTVALNRFYKAKAPRSSGSSLIPSRSSLGAARARSSCACGASSALCGSSSACRGCSSSSTSSRGRSATRSPRSARFSCW